MRVASVYRVGGWVNFCSGLVAALVRGSPSWRLGRRVWSSPPSSSRPYSYTARKPGNFTSDRLALNT